MQNNGTHRLVFPDGRPMIGDNQRVLSTVPVVPRQGVEIKVTPNALVCHITDGETKLDLTLDAQTATQLGVNLISAATLCSSGLLPTPPVPPAEPPDPLKHEHTDAPIAI